MKSMITIVAGARPNFMKIAPIIRSIRARQHAYPSMTYRLVHTGQHFDTAMSGNFFEQLGIPDPDSNLSCGGGSQAEQTASIMLKFEKELNLHRPKLLVVVGDVTSTMACTITAKKMCIDTAHVEGGIRSGDLSMPEEINRLITDSISDIFFTTSRLASDNLLNCNISGDRIYFVGNTMIDTLYFNKEKLIKPVFWDKMGLRNKNYFLLTLHRPSNVDDPNNLSEVLQNISHAAGDFPVVFPVHPRTRKILEFGQLNIGNIHIVDPQPYLEFIYLTRHARGVITDSGGVTEEATVLNVPCLTLRNTTERPETVAIGTNELIGNDTLKLRYYINMIKCGVWKTSSIPELWDGKTADRIIDTICNIYYKE